MKPLRQRKEVAAKRSPVRRMEILGSDARREEAEVEARIKEIINSAPIARGSILIQMSAGHWKRTNIKHHLGTTRIKVRTKRDQQQSLQVRAMRL
jgi:hypothetical protein